MSCDRVHVIERARPRADGPVSVCTVCGAEFGKWRRAKDYTPDNSNPQPYLFVGTDEGELLVSPVDRPPVIPLPKAPR